MGVPWEWVLEVADEVATATSTRRWTEAVVDPPWWLAVEVWVVGLTFVFVEEILDVEVSTAGEVFGLGNAVRDTSSNRACAARTESMIVLPISLDDEEV